jgi:transposase-like protein
MAHVHFLESTAARTLDMRKLRRLTDDEAYEMFKAFRWAEHGGKPVCPHRDCESFDIYDLVINRRTKNGPVPTKLFKCAGCRRQFSITSGTILASRKLPLADYIFAIALYVNNVKGHAALTMCRNLHVQSKSAFVLLHKLREAVGTLAEPRVLDSELGMEIDGAGFGGVRRQKNIVKERRHGKTVLEKRQSGVVMRERGPGGKLRVVTVKSEHLGLDHVRASVKPGSVIYADEAAHWNALAAEYDLRTVNHTKDGFVTAEANTNLAESFWSRARRSQYGIHHRISGRNVNAYLQEMALRENNRRVSNGGQFDQVLTAVTHLPVSREWKGYWHRTKAAGGRAAGPKNVGA